MSYVLDPGLLKDLTEAKADVARHGIVILRTVETELEPAMMAAARNSMSSSPRKLAQMKEEDLDEFATSLRKTAIKSARELRDLYTRLLAKLGTEYLVDLVQELEGIGQLFTWERIARASETLDGILAGKGFRPIALPGPEAVSENLRIELLEKWPAAFKRFKELAEQAAADIRAQEEEPEEPPPAKKRAKRTG
ncbi:MAG: hypothetical protein ACUVT7_09320 [Thermoplasmata archaeon]